MNRRLSPDEGHFIAGFIDGEAHLAIAEANGGQSFRCFMSLNVRDDDIELLEWIQARTGVGALRPVPARRTSKPQVQWLVRTQDDCRRLAEFLSEFELRGRKRRELEIWNRAIEVWTSGLTNRAVLARRLREQLLDARRFRRPEIGFAAAPAPPPDGIEGYLHGLLCAEGSFIVDRAKTGLSVHMRQDERPLLEMLREAVGVGRVQNYRAYPPSQPSASWHVSRLQDAIQLAAVLDPRRMQGRKAVELEIWLRAVAERHDARAAGRRSQLDDLISEFRAARGYRPGRAPTATHRNEDAKTRTLDILRRWAAQESGPLSSGRYAAARTPGWPTRNTITKRFGSWDAALSAAGLAKRAASTAESREARLRGGTASRAAHAEAQRERVLATLRYGVALHGSLPTAMQFFRWRLVDAPATPTQATVYRLFPGGWNAVLEAFGEPDPCVMSPAPR